MNDINVHCAESVELRRQAIQAAVDAKKSSAERNQLGQFATPNSLAVEIAGFIDATVGERLGEIRFADPSVGSGSFFSAALAVFGRDRIRSSVGVELDPEFADAAHDLWSREGLEVVRGDFTRIVADVARPSGPNLILANPPYVRHHHLDRQVKERLRHDTFELTGVKVNGLAGLYVYFVLLATAWMDDDGYAAWLVPSEFMDVNYGASLKTYLTSRVELIRMHRFDPDEVQFGDALVSSVVVVFRKSRPSLDHECEFSFGGTLVEPKVIDNIPLQRLRDCRKWTVYPSHPKNDRRASDEGGGAAIGDLFRVRRGIATGDNKFFVLDREEVRRQGLPEECLRPILPSPRNLKGTVVEADEDGYPLLERQHCLIDCDLPEHIVEERYPALWRYLQTASARGVRSGYLVSKRNPWYKQEQREACPYLCTYMGRGAAEKKPFRFIFNRSGAIATNLYLMLYPQRALLSMLKEHPERAVGVHELLGEVTGHELRGEGRVYGGGLNKIEPRELGRVSAASFVARWPELACGLRHQETAGLFD